jgi:hypothetical protein
MTLPLPPDNDSVPEELPLRDRVSREREAEKIRQEFVESRKRSIFGECDTSAKEMASDEQR